MKFCKILGLDRSFKVVSPSRPKRVVVFCHGFPGVYRLGKTASTLLARKIAWAEVYYQGDKERGGSFDFLESIESVRKSTAEIRRSFPGVKLWALGYSFGGFCVLNAIRSNPSLFDRVILLNPLTDFAFFCESSSALDVWKDANKVLSLKPRNFYERQIQKILAQHNPKDFAEELETPMTIILSRKEDVLSLPKLEKFCKKIRLQRDIIWVKNRGHALRGDEPELLKVLSE